MRLPVLLLLLLMLAACGQVRHVFPPAVTLEQLDAPPDGEWTAAVRLHNQSYDAGVHFGEVRLDLILDDTPVGTLEENADMPVAERNSDVLRIRFSPDQAGREQVSQGADGNHQIRYTIRGTVGVGDPGRRASNYDVEQDGWLSPVPGMLHRYR